MGQIYLITNLITNKQYVGQTKNGYLNRFNDHCSKRSKGERGILKKSIEKYGKNNFSITKIVDCDNSLLPEYESYYIQYYNTLSPTGYNLTTGGEKYEFSNETRRKMSISKKGIAPYKITDKIKEKISISLKGRKLTPEVRQKMKISNIQRLKKYSEDRKKIVVNIENGVFYSSIKEAAIYNNISDTHLSSVLSGRFNNYTKLKLS